jgi:predicted RNA-binding Zn-ribbon protein involved in translation (DUF1610 family)
VVCDHCGERFTPGEAAGTFDGDTARYQCPECGEWLTGLPPG